ncbi:uncharacterized protein LOC111909341 [Lactuca sativa]|uniref:START domain-containing protein n=1 Tax=Lactuca sativa TaxID=4236 RepID=A0A9R1V9K2_LACSA|nr:uncharacterized protein LOC111909341 [Lactuca sativa]XP_023760916.1 uncharacterized protein LOC111909341 [Lactuca sativa]XP_023760917.1 uncharacterized protein LOC111909341 [Lactuca sativa]XP_023760918.1 uncharacterized protein LOC111909341 [Lactuca sativa]XP_023760919.1 uncharacterized protein LOC111909341 [Lactuca sativa]XP_023760920.1 uncharacterized protein LOC111909341 [Lactuca sativa]XP_042751651.1 uncharacterized protein LOC111909341 [Lactuca sativa]XP_052620577.1 uncharacterized p
MEGKENITEYRDKLDKTLKSDDLCNVEFLKKLVENQLSKSSQHEDQEYSDNLVQKRTKEVANFIGMLRSTSGSVDEVSHNGWKIKHDNQDCRVMYREGPTGTPFHSLLAEGYVDGPLDVCMCISCEASLYPKWWPQFNIPTFKVTSSEIVKKIRMGEQISLVRMKLSWPLSTREALVHYVTIDYFQDGLIIVLLNSISETEIIDIDTHGFTKDGIPDVENVTRIDIVGGVAIQKVSTNRSYFRTIANMDIKLDFVPPTIINFVSRQLIGSGFKLYKKEVASVCKGDEDFSMALKDPCYHRIREALYLENNEQNEVSKQEDIKIVHEILEQQRDEDIKELKTQNPVCEIEEIEESEKPHEDSNNNGKEVNEDSNKKIIVGRKQVIISPEVNQALGTLEKVISIFREIGFNPRSMSLSRFANNLFADLEDKKSNDSKRFVTQVNESTLKSSQESRNGFDDDEDTPSSFSFVINEAITSTLAEKDAINGEVKNIDESGISQKKMKKQRFCCISFTSGGVG